MEYLVSIIVPIYNMESTLENSVNSLLQQTYKNIEIVLINDGSTDNSQLITERIAGKDKRIKVIHKNNEGVSVARNKGLEVARGEYIVFVDPDDWASPTMIETLLKYSLQENSDITACAATVTINENEQIETNSFFRTSNMNVNKIRAIAQLLTNDYYKDSDIYINIGVPWGKLYRKELLTKYQIQFKPELRRNQDNIFNLYAFHFANKISYIDIPLYYYDFDHISSLHSKVSEDAEILYSNLAIETYQFASQFYYDNSLIMNLTYNKILKFIAEILNKKILHPDYTVGFNQREKEIDELQNKSPFKEVLNLPNFHFVSKNIRLLFYLLKYKLYKLIYLLFYLRKVLLEKIN